MADLQPVGRPALALHLQHHRRQGKKAVVAIEMASAHGELRSQDPVTDPQRLPNPASQVQLPTGRSQAPDRAGLVAAQHLQALEMAHVVADQIGARGPGG